MAPFRKAMSGDPLQIPAATYNALIDAAIDHRNRQMDRGGNPLADREQANIILVKNESGATRERFDILGINGPIFTRADNATSFKSRIALRGVAPTTAHAGRFVVLLEPAPANTIVRAYVTGVCLARVEMADEGHTFADVADGVTDHLASATSGTAALLWVEPIEQREDPAIAWCIVRFGGGGSGGSSTPVDLSNEFILALLTSVQRFSADNPDLLAYHWRQAQIKTDGTAEEHPNGNGSKTIPSCDSRTVDTENATYSVLADPAAAEVNLTNAVYVPETETMSFRITGTEDTTHTVTSYTIRCGSAFTPALGAGSVYGANASQPPGSAPYLDVVGAPIGTNLYVRVVTATSDAGSNANLYIIQVGINGDPLPSIVVENAVINDESVVLTSPISGDYGGDIADELTDLDIAFSQTTPTNFWISVGTGLGDWNAGDPETYDVYDVGSELGDVTSHTIPNLPVDGVTRYLYVGWRTSPSFDWNYNVYAITLTPAADRRAINIEDVTRILTESQEGPAGLTEIADGSEDDETAIAVPVLVRIWRTTDAAGLDRFIFEHVEQEFVGEILAESAEDEDDDFDDARYWVKLIKVDNADPDNAAGDPLAFSDATHAASRAIIAENLAESAAGTHNLAVGTRVMVRTMRGGDKPWITRFVFNAGGTGGGARFLAKVQSQGPSAEADYTDARYWVQEVDDTTSGATDALSLSEVSVEAGGRWVTAHNIVERGIGTSDLGGHYIRKAVTGISLPTRYVIVREVPLTTGMKYIIESYPGQMQEGIYAAKVTCKDENGCPVPTWYRLEGPAFVAAATPPDCA